MLGFLRGALFTHFTLCWSRLQDSKGGGAQKAASTQDRLIQRLARFHTTGLLHNGSHEHQGLYTAAGQSPTFMLQPCFSKARPVLGLCLDKNPRENVWLNLAGLLAGGRQRGQHVELEKETQPMQHSPLVSKNQTLHFFFFFGKKKMRGLSDRFGMTIVHSLG